MNHHFSATLSSDDSKRHIPHKFSVPPNCNRITIKMRYGPRTVNGLNNLLTLTLFDPDGFRGAGHRGGDTHEVELTPSMATRGYLPGALAPGEWTVQIDTHLVLPDVAVTYTLDVTVDRSEGEVDGAPSRSTPDFSRVIHPSQGWYRGDLHSHTIHSDASWTAQELVAAARAMGLDFIALTDHNTVSPLAEMAQLGGDGLLTLGGQELTTFWGHAVCLGAHEWLDWRVDREGRGMEEIAAQLYDAGKLYIIAHPYAIGDPYCTGCRWLYSQMMPGNARLIEVWNGPWFGEHPLEQMSNEDGLAFYYRCLNQGRRLVMTAGSDAHGPRSYERGPGFNVVYAHELSEQGILRALAKGHHYLSSGPALHLRAHAGDGAAVMMGDTLSVNGGDVHLHADWAEAPAGSTLRLVVNGAVYAQNLVNSAGDTSWTIPTNGVRWCTIELRGEGEKMLAVTNPIFLAPNQTP